MALASIKNIDLYRSAKLALLYKSMFFIEETYLAGGGSTPWNPIWTAVKRTVLKSVLKFSQSSIEVLSGLLKRICFLGRAAARELVFEQSGWQCDGRHMVETN